MAKFVVECPKCHRILEAKSGKLFGTKALECTCGEQIVLKGKNAVGTRECPNCHNEVVFRLDKGKKAICPICNAALISEESVSNKVSFPCRQCGCILYVDKNETEPVICPSCKAANDVQMNIQMMDHRRSNKPVVIQYEGDAETIVWKHPLTDFITGSILIVHENQEAVFFCDGQMLDSLPPGRHTLETRSLPLISEMEKLIANGMHPFHSEVYFINKAVQTGLKWGTNPSLHDPASNIHITLRCHGKFNLQVVNSRKLLGKYVGTTNALSREALFDPNGYFVSSVRGTIKSIMAGVISDAKISVLEVDKRIIDIAEMLETRVRDLFIDYGMEITEIVIDDIGLPDPEEEPLFWEVRNQIAEQRLAEGKANIDLIKTQGEQAIEIAKAQTERYKKQLDIEAQAERQRQLGYSYQEDRTFDTMNKMAENKGTMGEINNTGIGLGMSMGVGVPMGVAMGSAVSKMMKSALDDVQASVTQNSASRNMGSASENVNSACQMPTTDIRKRFAELESIKDFLSEEEYQQMRKEILDSLK